MRAFLLVLVMGYGLAAFGGEYWACVPMDTSAGDPRILITHGEGKQLHFLTDRDLKRDSGMLPQGQYVGTQAGASSFSVYAKLDVSSYFPNLQSGSLGTYLSLSLQIKSSLFGTEAYLLFPTETTDFVGEILNNYACKHHF